MALRIIFMGTPDFAVSSLAAVLDAGHEVVCVYSQPPRPAGRGQKDRPTPVHAFAEARGIEVRTPRTLKTPEAQAEFAALRADIAVVAAYGLILPQAVLDAPRLGCVNVHASLLPRWRGAAPIQRAIMAGDAETGVTIMQMDAGLDTGAMLLKDRLPIPMGMTAGQLHDALAEQGAGLLLKALDGLERGLLTAEPQPVEGVTYAAKITKDEARIDWNRPARDLAWHVNGLSPFPGAWFAHGDERIKLLAAQPAEGGPSAEPGLVLDGQMTIACGDGALRPLILQKAGGKALDLAAFLRGYSIAAGTKL